MSEAEEYQRIANMLRLLPGLIRETRQARGLTLRQAAAQVGVAHTSMRRLESGEDATTTTLLKHLQWLAKERD